MADDLLTQFQELHTKFVGAGQPSADPLDQYMSEVERKYKLPAGILRAIRQIETGGVAGDPNAAVSSAGAVGMMQIKPNTAGQYDPNVNLQDPRASIDIAAQHLARMQRAYGITDPTQLALYYNRGEGNAQREGIKGMTDYSGLPAEGRGYAEKFQRLYRPAIPSSATAPPGVAPTTGLTPPPTLSQSPGPHYQEDLAALSELYRQQHPIASVAGRVGDFFEDISQAPGIRHFGEVMGAPKRALEENVLGPLFGYDAEQGETFGTHTAGLIGQAAPDVGPVVGGLAKGAYTALADMATDPVVWTLEALGGALGTVAGGPVGAAAGVGLGAAIGKWFLSSQKAMGLHRNLTTVSRGLGLAFQGQMALGAGAKLPRALEQISLDPNDQRGYENLSGGLIDAYFTAKSLLPRSVSKGVGQFTDSEGNVIRIEGPNGELVSLPEVALYTKDPTGASMLKLWQGLRGNMWEGSVRQGLLEGDPSVAPETIIHHGDVVGEASMQVGQYIKFNPARLASELILVPEGQRAAFLKSRMEALLYHEFGHWAKDQGIQHSLPPQIRQVLHDMYFKYQDAARPLLDQVESARKVIEQQGGDPLTDARFLDLLNQAETLKQQWRMERDEVYKKAGIDPSTAEGEAFFQQNALAYREQVGQVLEATWQQWEQAFQPEGGIERALGNFLGQVARTEGVTGRPLMHPGAQGVAQELLTGKRQYQSPEELARGTQKVYDLVPSAQAIPEPPVMPKGVEPPAVDHAALQRPFKPGKAWGSEGGLGLSPAERLQKALADLELAESDPGYASEIPRIKAEIQAAELALDQQRQGQKSKLPPPPVAPEKLSETERKALEEKQKAEAFAAKLPKYWPGTRATKRLPDGREEEVFGPMPERPYLSVSQRSREEVEAAPSKFPEAQYSGAGLRNLINTNERLKELEMQVKGAGEGGAERVQGRLERPGYTAGKMMGNTKIFNKGPLGTTLRTMSEEMRSTAEKQAFDLLASKGGLGEKLITPYLEAELKRILQNPAELAKLVPSAFQREAVERIPTTPEVRAKSGKEFIEKRRAIPFKDIKEEGFDLTKEAAAKKLSVRDLQEIQKRLGVEYRPEQFEYSNFGKALAQAIKEGKGEMTINDLVRSLEGKPLSYEMGVHRVPPEEQIGQRTILPGSKDYRELVVATPESKLRDVLHWRPEAVPGAVSEARMETRTVQGQPTGLFQEAQNIAKGVEGNIGPEGRVEVSPAITGATAEGQRGEPLYYQAAGEGVPGVTKGIRYATAAGATDSLNRGERQIAWTSPRTALNKFGTQLVHWERDPKNPNLVSVRYLDPRAAAKVSKRSDIRKLGRANGIKIDINDPNALGEIQSWLSNVSFKRLFGGAGLATEEILQKKFEREASEILRGMQTKGQGLYTPERANYQRMYRAGGELDRELQAYAERNGLKLVPITDERGARLFPLEGSEETSKSLAQREGTFGYLQAGGTLPGERRWEGRKHMARGYKVEGTPETFERIKSQGGLASEGGLGLMGVRPEESRLTYDPKTGWPEQFPGETPRPAPLMQSLLADRLRNKKFADQKSPKAWMQTVDKLKAEGVTEDMLRWSGVKDWLQERERAGEKVTQEDIVNHVLKHTTVPTIVEKSGEFMPTAEMQNWREAPAYKELIRKDTELKARLEQLRPDLREFTDRLGLAIDPSISGKDPKQFAAELVSKYNKEADPDDMRENQQRIIRAFENIEENLDRNAELFKKFDARAEEVRKFFLEGGEISKGTADELYEVIGHPSDYWEQLFQRAADDGLFKRKGNKKVITLSAIEEAFGQGNFTLRQAKKAFWNFIDTREGETTRRTYGEFNKEKLETSIRNRRFGFLADTVDNISDILRATHNRSVGETLKEQFPDLYRNVDSYEIDYQAEGSPIAKWAEEILTSVNPSRFREYNKTQSEIRDLQYEIRDKQEEGARIEEKGAALYPDWNRASVKPGPAAAGYSASAAEEIAQRRAQQEAAKSTAYHAGSEPYVSDRMIEELGYDPKPVVERDPDTGMYKAYFERKADIPLKTKPAEGMEPVTGEPVPGDVISAQKATPGEVSEAAGSGHGTWYNPITGNYEDKFVRMGATAEEAVQKLRQDILSSAGEVEIGERTGYGHHAFGQGTLMHHRGESLKLPKELGGTEGGRDDVAVLGEIQSDVFQRIEKVASSGLAKQGFAAPGWKYRREIFSGAAHKLSEAAQDLSRQANSAPEATWKSGYQMEQFGNQANWWKAASEVQRAQQPQRKPPEGWMEVYDKYVSGNPGQRGGHNFYSYNFAHWLRNNPEGQEAFKAILDKAQAEWEAANPDAQAAGAKAKRLQAMAELTSKLGDAFAKSPYYAPWNKDWAEVSAKERVADAIQRGFSHFFVRDAAYAKASAGSYGMKWNYNPQTRTATIQQLNFTGFETPRLEEVPVEGPTMPGERAPGSGTFRMRQRTHGGQGTSTVEIDKPTAQRNLQQVRELRELLELTVERPENLDVVVNKDGQTTVVLNPKARARIEELLSKNPFSITQDSVWRWADYALGSQDWSNVPELWKYGRIINEVESIYDGIVKAGEEIPHGPAYVKAMGGVQPRVGEIGPPPPVKLHYPTADTTLKRAEGFDAWYEGHAKRVEKILRKMGWKGEVQRIKGDEFPNVRGSETVSTGQGVDRNVPPATHVWGWLFKDIPSREAVESDPQKLQALMASHGGLGFDPIRGDRLPSDMRAEAGRQFAARTEDWKAPLSKVDHPLWEAINTPRALITSLDLSGVLRQGMVATAREALTHPFRLADNFRKSLKALTSEETYRASMEALEQADGMAELRSFGMDFAQKEEAYAGTRVLTSLAKKFGLPDFPRASERAYTYYLNRIRFDLARDKFNRLKDMGFDTVKDKWLFESAAKWSNIVTGRGNLPTGKDPFSQAVRSAEGLMNTVMFSPRLMLSRLAMLNPYVYGRTMISAGKSKGATGALGAFWAVHGLDVAAAAGLAAALTTGIKAAFGGDIEDDPRSSDFAQARIGNTRVDLTGGLRTYITSAARLLTGTQKSTIGGNIREIGALETVGRFFRGKLSPVPGTIADVLSGRKVTGEEVLGPAGDILSGKEPLTKESALEFAKAVVEGPIAGLTVPMILRDLKNLYDEDPAKAIGLAAPLILGAGVTVHELRGGLTPRVRDVFKQTMIEPMSPLRSVSTGVKDLSGKPISLDIPYMLRKRLEEEIDAPLYERLEQMVSTPQFEALSPIQQRVFILSALSPLYRMRRGQAMKALGVEALRKGVREKMVPEQWKKLGGPPLLPTVGGGEESEASSFFD